MSLQLIGSSTFRTQNWHAAPAIGVYLGEYDWFPRILRYGSLCWPVFFVVAQLAYGLVVKCKVTNFLAKVSQEQEDTSAPQGRLESQQEDDQECDDTDGNTNEGAAPGCVFIFIAA